MSLFTFFNPAKDYLIAGAVRLWFNQAKKHYGNMTHINIDSQKRSLDIELDLKGEATPLQINIKNYRLIDESGETYIELSDITTSREWINALLGDYPDLEKRRYKVPAAVKVLL